MLISSEATGGQIVSTREAPRFYDDLGCLAADASSAPADARIYVRTANGGWLDAETAAYARPPAAHTPMGSGVLAFESMGEARAAASTVPLLTWRELLAHETMAASR